MKKLILFTFTLLTISLSYSQKDSYFDNSKSEISLNNFNEINFVYATPVTDLETNYFELNYQFGSRLSEKFSAGLGAGLRVYSNSSSDFSINSKAKLIPLYSNIRWYFIESSKTSLYGSLKLGYSFNIDDSFDPTGLYIEPLIGTVIKSSNSMKLNLGLGFSMQTISGNADTLRQTSGTLTLNLGVHI